MFVTAKWTLGGLRGHHQQRAASQEAISTDNGQHLYLPARPAPADFELLRWPSLGQLLTSCVTHGAETPERRFYALRWQTCVYLLAHVNEAADEWTTVGHAREWLQRGAVCEEVPYSRYRHTQGRYDQAKGAGEGFLGKLYEHGRVTMVAYFCQNDCEGLVLAPGALPAEAQAPAPPAPPSDAEPAGVVSMEGAGAAPSDAEPAGVISMEVDDWPGHEHGAMQGMMMLSVEPDGHGAEEH